MNVSYSIFTDLTRLTSDIFEIGQFFMSIRNYDSTQTNCRKNLSSPLVRKSNLKIINIFGREILKCGSGRKTLSKTHRPEIGVAAPWELIKHSILTSLDISDVETVWTWGDKRPPQKTEKTRYFEEKN